MSIEWPERDEESRADIAMAGPINEATNNGELQSSEITTTFMQTARSTVQNSGESAQLSGNESSKQVKMRASEDPHGNFDGNAGLIGAQPAYYPEATVLRANIYQNNDAQPQYDRSRQLIVDYLQEIINTHGVASASVEALIRDDSPNLERILARTPPSQLNLWLHTTLLHLAAAAQPSMIGILVSRGFNVNAVNENGSTPLHFACDQGCHEACNVLVSLGADVNTQDIFGNTPMMRAALAGHMDVVEVMTSLGANPRIENLSGMSPQETINARSRGPMASCYHWLMYGLGIFPRCLRASCKYGWSSEKRPTDISQKGISVIKSGEVTQASGGSMNIATPDVEDAVPSQIAREVNVEGEAIADSAPLGTEGLRARKWPWPPLCGLVFLTGTLFWMVFCIGYFTQNEALMVGISPPPEYAVILILVVLYTIQFVEALVGGWKYFKENMNSDRAFVASQLTIRDKVSLNMSIVCYHQERRTRQVKQSNGHYTTETYYVRVNTHSASQKYTFDEQWVEPIRFQAYTGMCLVSFDAAYEFADADTEMVFEQAKGSFIDRHNLDQRYDFSVTDETPVPSSIVGLDGIHSTWLLNFPRYVIASMLLLSVPYRMLLVSMSCKQHISVRRFVYKAH